MITFAALRRQIESTEELGSIVRTMKSLAAVHVHSYETAARALANFEETVELGFQVLLRHPALAAPPQPPAHRGPAAAVVIGTDQGMCGAFNDRIVSFVRQWYRDRHQAERGPVLVVGRRSSELMAGSELAPADALAASNSLSGVTVLVEELLVRLEAWRAAARFERLFVFHNRRNRGRRPLPRVVQLLPLPAGWLRELAHRPWTGPSLPTFTLEPDVLFSQLTRQRLFGALYRAMVESMECENFSRLEAMQAAETNIAERLEELRAAFRQERQAAITAELLDLVSGYEAAGGSDLRQGTATEAPGP